MIAPARVAAYEVLRAVGRGHSDLPSALARVRAKLADERDRALAGEIAAGTLRWQRACDAIVTAFTTRAASKLDPEVLDILRLSIFQLLHLDRVPASAVVNDGVQLARKAGKQSASGLVNAVLRRVSRERAHLPLPARPEDAGDTAAARAYLSVSLSHPEWLVDRWLDRYGFEAAEAWARFDNEPVRLTLRANTLRMDREAVRRALASNGVETETPGSRRTGSPSAPAIRSSPLLPARACSWCRTRHRSSWGCSPTRARENASSTPARPRAARPRNWRAAREPAA